MNCENLENALLFFEEVRGFKRCINLFRFWIEGKIFLVNEWDGMNYVLKRYD